MRKFLKTIIKGTLFCLLLLAASLTVCLAAGLVKLPDTGEQVCEVPAVRVIEPKLLSRRMFLSRRPPLNRKSSLSRNR